MIGYCIPLFIASIPFYLQKYGPQSLLTDEVDSWCGIKRKERNTSLMKSNDLIYDNLDENKYMEINENGFPFKNKDIKEKFIFSIEKEDNFIDYEALFIDLFIRVFPISACCLINTIFYIKILKIYVMMSSKSQLLVVVHHRIIWMLILPIFCWFCEIVLRILEFTNSIKYKKENDLYVYIIEIIDSIILPFYGAGNFFIYAWNPFVRQEWGKKIFESNESNEKENEIGQNFKIDRIQKKNGKNKPEN